jgi:hypothetical protein
VHRSPSSLFAATSWLFAASILVATGCTGTAGTNGTGTNSDGTGGATSSGAGGATTSSGSGGSSSGAGGASITGSGGASSGSGGTTGSGGATGAGGAASGTGGASGPDGGTAPQPFKGVANSACNDLTTLKASWYYNWTTTAASNCAFQPFVPMIAGKSEKTADAVTSALNKIAAAGYKTVLGFNEPNKTDQANLTVDQVVGMWPALTANAGIRVGSPATSADAAGQTWFTSFMSTATTMSFRVDFIALHWYGWNAGSCDNKASQLESYIKWAEAIPGNRPIWITEWGCLNLSNPDMATVQAFYTAAIAMFAKHPRIERYAWYPWTTNNNLVDTSDALTSLGTAFAAEPSTK